MPPRSRARGASSSAAPPSANQNKGKPKKNKRSNPGSQPLRRPIQPDAPSNEDPTTICTVCASKAIDWTIGPCRHAVCGDCAHRMRVLYNRTTCVICSQPQAQVVVIPLSQWRDDITYADALALPNLTLDDGVGMWFADQRRLNHCRSVRGYMCSHKTCSKKPNTGRVFANPTQLRAHARSEHRSIYCEICFTGEKSFVSELQQFTLDQGKNSSGMLRTHLRKTHPQCRFCRHFYLDDDKLYAHLQEVHESCSVCERAGRMHEYYANFTDLERHYKKDHFPCPHESCRGVVFATAFELQTHEHTRHVNGPGGSAARQRALRVNLQQLHEGHNPRGSEDDAREQQRQAARRRAFLSANVVFSGALNFDDATVPDQSAAHPTTTSDHASSSQSRAAQMHESEFLPQGEPSSASSAMSLPTRPPDDGKFHVSRPPRNTAESQFRNAALVRRMRTLVDPAAYEQFKQASGNFHNGNLDAEQFFDSAIETFGNRTAVRDVLPELSALLPSLLLREALLKVCLRRTDSVAPPGAITEADGSASTSAGRNASARTDEIEGESFPTLNGRAPVLPTRTARPQRFGAPGPEEFPRLARGGRGSAGVGGRGRGYTGDSSGVPVTSTNRTTAASVLRARGANGRMFGNRSGMVSAPRTAPATGSAAMVPAGPSGGGPAGNEGNTSGREISAQRDVSGVSLSENAFPTLGGRAPEAVSEERGEVRANETADQPGAIWGGATQVTGRQGRRRGRGRQPAAPPNWMAEQGNQNDGSVEHTITEGGAHAADLSDGSAGSASRRGVVIDVAEIAKNRKLKLEQSSVPKIGSSGYGFAWERKKAQQKKKEIRSSVRNARGDS